LARTKFLGGNKMTKVAINGFGRIGRLAFRQMFDTEGYEVVAINDLTDAATLAHLLKYDTAQGRFEKEITSSDNSITVEGKEITIYAQKDPRDLPWGDLDVDVVLECTGFFTTLESASAHIEAGAKKVVISAPAKGDLKTIVFGTNEDILDGSEKVISAASCTTNCLAPMADALNKLAPIDSGYMTTIHAYTNDQNTLDAPHKKGLRRARAAAQNIVPATTGAAAAIGLVIPELKGKLDGNAQRVPVPTGSLTELTAVVSADVTADDINAAMKAAANESFGYNTDEIVSSDIIGIKYGSLFDATLTKATSLGNGKTLVKVTSWYDNENSYTSQMVRTIKYFNEL
jgi:glyceraldehyde 3-phosphate dehydrogenase